MSDAVSEVEQPSNPETSGEQHSNGHKRTLISFPWQFWFSLISLFLIFIGIGASYFWAIRLPDTQVPTWIPGLLSTLWVGAGMGVLGLFFWMWREFVRFGNDLTRWSACLRKGNLNARMPIRENGCLSIKTREQINAITDNYQALSRAQRQRLNRQQRFIEQKKHHLQVLYDVASAINRSDNLEDLLKRFLTTLGDVVEAKAVAIRLLNTDGKLRLVASIGLDDKVMEQENSVPSPECACAQVAIKGDILSQETMQQCSEKIGMSFFRNDSSTRMLAIPLQYRDKNLGVYNLFVSHDRAANLEEEYELLISIGQHLGMAIEKAHVDEEAHTLSIIEERTRMAHELHDSLAQTLASLRFKVRLFDDSLNSGNEAIIGQELEGLENTIDDAYAELRSLITDFRAPIDGKGVVRAVKNLTERFKKETEMEVFFYHNWHLDDFDPDAELEVIRIVQEALNNVKKHSQASTVRILMYSSEEGRCSVLVEDDGTGMPEIIPGPDPITGEHIGIGIMQDRAAKLHGELQYESDPDEGGTLLQLNFDVPRKRRFSKLLSQTDTKQAT
uniref:histidine kinase n=1 Tax=uncultured Thiotrichaceae bacterium TaxID=298394 RepID=A0A6S6UAB5_9GAMM|nr:MAG: Nitrate/nitrite sensor protein (EC [uncultured Thiotrichaceae bacterium]